MLKICNHQKCCEKLIEKVEEISHKNSLNLTPIRKKVLEIIASSHKPARAYDILAKLKDGGFSDKPPTVYRALDFLIENKIVHRLNTLNAYIACFGEEIGGISCFLICTKCQNVEEFQDERIDAAMIAISSARNLKIASANLELEFECEACKS